MARKPRTKEQEEIKKKQDALRQQKLRERKEAKIATAEKIRASATPIVDTLTEYGPVLRDLLSLVKQAILEGTAEMLGPSSPEVFVLPSNDVTQLALLKHLNDPSQDNPLASDKPEIRFLGLSPLQWQEMPDELLSVFRLRETVARWKAARGASRREFDELAGSEAHATSLGRVPQERPNADSYLGVAPEDTPEISDCSSFETDEKDNISSPDPIKFEHMRAAYVDWREITCPYGTGTLERREWERTIKFPYKERLWSVRYETLEVRPKEGTGTRRMSFISDKGPCVVGEIVSPLTTPARAA
ncbi:hypothetical protein [Microvirga sp. M2]|uniref:hypothetical protein n=1 Tax=Microvirga sp. M2 TaxID=3073270 RepID=UPI0039C3981C